VLSGLGRREKRRIRRDTDVVVPRNGQPRGLYHDSCDDRLIPRDVDYSVYRSRHPAGHPRGRLCRCRSIRAVTAPSCTSRIAGFPRSGASRVWPGSVTVVDFAIQKIIATWPIPGAGSPEMGNVSVDGQQLWLFWSLRPRGLHHRHHERRSVEDHPRRPGAARTDCLAAARSVLTRAHWKDAIGKALEVRGILMALGRFRTGSRCRQDVAVSRLRLGSRFREFVAKHPEELLRRRRA